MSAQVEKRGEPWLPACLPHGVADCPICLAEAERIVDEEIAALAQAAESLD